MGRGDGRWTQRAAMQTLRWAGSVQRLQKRINWKVGLTTRVGNSLLSFLHGKRGLWTSRFVGHMLFVVGADPVTQPTQATLQGHAACFSTWWGPRMSQSESSCHPLGTSEPVRFQRNDRSAAKTYSQCVSTTFAIPMRAVRPHLQCPLASCS